MAVDRVKWRIRSLIRSRSDPRVIKVKEANSRGQLVDLPPDWYMGSLLRGQAKHGVSILPDEKRLNCKPVERSSVTGSHRKMGCSASVGISLVTNQVFDWDYGI